MRSCAQRSLALHPVASVLSLRISLYTVSSFECSVMILRQYRYRPGLICHENICVILKREEEHVEKFFGNILFSILAKEFVREQDRNINVIAVKLISWKNLSQIDLS